MVHPACLHRKHVRADRVHSCAEHESLTARRTGDRRRHFFAKSCTVGWGLHCIALLLLWAAVFAVGAAELSDIHGEDGDSEAIFWMENARLLADPDEQRSDSGDCRNRTESLQPGFTFCVEQSRGICCKNGNGTYDTMQSSEGVVEESPTLVFIAAPGRNITDYTFSASSSSQQLLKDENIGIDPIVSEDEEGGQLVNVTIGLVFEPRVGKTEITVMAEDQVGNDNYEFKLDMSVAGLMFIDSDVSTRYRQSDYVRPASRFVVPESEMNSVVRQKDDELVAEAVMYNNVLSITSYESLVRNPYVYIKVDKQLKTSSMSRELRISDIDVEFERETYKRQIKWKPEICRIATTSKDPVKIPPTPIPPPDPNHMRRPKPGFLKGINPKETVNLTRSDCGISFSYDGDLLGLRFEKYRVGTGTLRIHFALAGFKLNGKSATFETDLTIIVKNPEEAPPVFYRIDGPDLLDPNGGDELSVVGFNIPEDVNKVHAIAVQVDGVRRIFPEDPKRRRAFNTYDIAMTFVSLPATGDLTYEILQVPQKVHSRSAMLDGSDFRELDGSLIFTALTREVQENPFIHYGELERRREDIEYTFGFPNYPVLSLMRDMQSIRQKFGNAAKLGRQNVFALDCRAGTFYAINGRTGVFSDSWSSSSTRVSRTARRIESAAAEVNSWQSEEDSYSAFAETFRNLHIADGNGTDVCMRSAREVLSDADIFSSRDIFAGWVDVGPDERGPEPEKLEDLEEDSEGSRSNAGFLSGAEQVLKMEGEKVTLRFRTNPYNRDEVKANIEEYVSSGRARSELGYQVQIVTNSDVLEQIRAAGGVLDAVAITSIIASVVAAVGVQIGSALAAGTAAIVAGTTIPVDPTAGVGAATSGTGTHASPHANPTTIIHTVQITAGRGLVSSTGVTSPYTEVAAGYQAFLLLVKPPWDKSDAKKTASRILSQLPALSVRQSQNFYDILDNEAPESVFIGQLFYIVLIVSILAVIHLAIHFGLRRRTRLHAIGMNIMPKIELIFLNFVHLGIYIGCFRILVDGSTSAGFKALATVLLVLFGLGYPAAVLYVLKKNVSPHLNEIWLKRYFPRYILRGGWTFFNRYSDAESREIEGAWRKRDMEDPFAAFWFVERKSKRFSGVWCSRSAFQTRFGDIFEQYRGQYYAYFFWELVWLAIEGTAIGALKNTPQLQGVVIVAASSLNLLVLLWLVPFNDLLEQGVQMLIGFINVITAAVQLYLEDMDPTEDSSKMFSSIILWLNVSAIVGAGIYALFAAIEIAWHSRSRIQKFLRRCLHKGTRFSSWSSDRSSSSRSTSCSVPSDDPHSDSDVEPSENVIEDVYIDYREPYNRDGSPIGSDESRSNDDEGGSSSGHLGSYQQEGDSTVGRRSVKKRLRGWESFEGPERSECDITEAKIPGERDENAEKGRAVDRPLSFARTASSPDSNWSDEFDACLSAASTGGDSALRQGSLGDANAVIKKRSYLLSTYDGRGGWDGGEEILEEKSLEDLRRGASGISNDSSLTDQSLRSLRSGRGSSRSGGTLLTGRSRRSGSSREEDTVDDVHAVD